MRLTNILIKKKLPLRLIKRSGILILYFWKREMEMYNVYCIEYAVYFRFLG